MVIKVDGAKERVSEKWLLKETKDLHKLKGELQDRFMSGEIVDKAEIDLMLARYQNLMAICQQMQKSGVPGGGRVARILYNKYDKIVTHLQTDLANPKEFSFDSGKYTYVGKK